MRGGLSPPMRIFLWGDGEIASSAFLQREKSLPHYCRYGGGGQATALHLRRKVYAALISHLKQSIYQYHHGSIALNRARR